MYKIKISDPVFSIDNLNIKDCEEDFPSRVKLYLKMYESFLHKTKVSSKIVEQVSSFAKNINRCLIEYYSGQHDSANFYFLEAMCNIDYKDILHPLNEEMFYRARKNDSDIFSKEEMFHIPFEKRYLVSTQRYSYPGLPCLYLASSLDLCCDELNCHDDNLNIALIEKEKDKEIFILDLFFFDSYDFQNLSLEEFEKFIKFWPLVACCSFVYEYTDEMKFRPDYIIPQLLLEYIIDKKAEFNLQGIDIEIYGIRYHSVKTDFWREDTKAKKDRFANYVFPALSVSKSGVCRILDSFFAVKQVLLLKQLK